MSSDTPYAADWPDHPDQAEVRRLRAEKDGAYTERNALVAALFRLTPWPKWWAYAPDADGWIIVYLETPAGQVSWHISVDEARDLFDWSEVLIWTHTDLGNPRWDGHTTDEKYRRLATLREMESDR